MTASRVEKVVLAKTFPLFETLSDEVVQQCMPLKINGGDVAFLKNPLKEGARFCEVKINGFSKVWVLEFFRGSPFSVTMIAVFREFGSSYLDQVGGLSNGTDVSFIDKQDNELKESAEKCLGVRTGGVQTSHILLRSADTLSEEVFRMASKWVRGSWTLRQDSYREHSQRYVAVDGKGLSMVAPASGHPQLHAQFERSLILFALGQAYQIAIDRISAELAEACEQLPRLRSLYHDLLIFNAKFFFRYPVKLKNIELPFIWEQIHERFALSQLNTELLAQTEAVKGLLDEEARRRDEMVRQRAARRESRVNFGLTVIGVLIGLLSLLTLVEITPEMLTEFWAKWRQFFNS